MTTIVVQSYCLIDDEPQDFRFEREFGGKMGMWDALDWVEPLPDSTERFYTLSDDRGEIVSTFGPNGFCRSRH